MNLTREEREMLDGEHGDRLAHAMDLLKRLGEAYDAEGMIDISGGHLFAWKINGELPGNAVLSQIETMTEGTRLKVPCTTNPVCLNPDLAETMGIPADVVEEHGPNISKLQQMCREMGAMPTFSCHDHSPLQPRLGANYALTESNVCMFANSWYGIRSNMEGDLTALAAAMTGKTPEYGMHLKENRFGQVLVRLSGDVDAGNLTTADFGAISYHAGEMIGDDRIPVYEGFPKAMGPTHVKHMQPQVVHSSSPLFHIVGVTPEAPTLEAACGGKPPNEVVSVGRREIMDAYQKLNTTERTDIDVIGLGCPHCTLEEIAALASELDGKRVHSNVRLLIGTSAAVAALADRMGLVERIREAGGMVLTDMCTVGMLLLGLIERWNIRYVATNSACAAGIRAEHPDFVRGIEVRFGSTRQCIQGAISGRWEDSHGKR
jgi:predicted aconitase